ncbi:hypothetical protein [Massilia endophytica]|uniref:hypothetical protein n=1 Tax=Massilia endophytica TaxID=2899220 RepID=UPI001E5CDC80|nr:hypothetical protein [Massilia endophytica]UGQ45763.1 hypothetical protein LSQ66_18520 [Massilia endophytica]
MKKTFIAALAVFSLTGMATAIAGPQSLQDPAKAGSVQISTTQAPRYQLGTSEFLDYAYTYKFDNGSVVRFSEKANRYYAEMKGAERTRLYPVAPGKFRTAEGVDVAFSDRGETVAVTNMHLLPNPVAMLPVEGAVIARR